MMTRLLLCLVACFAVSLGYTTKVKRDVTTSDQTVIIDKHNTLRDGVGAATGTLAANMQKAKWDADLATKAQAWADTCADAHDPDAAREPLDSNGAPILGQAVGQNMGWGYNNWDACIQGWYDEIAFFTYGMGLDESKKNPPTPFVIGHFTQVVQAGVARIGCGYKDGCSITIDGTTYSDVFVCNYVGANWNETNPYAEGTTAASSCPGNQSGNLCDFGGKLCKNGGTLNLGTGTCSCVENFSGDECETVTCPGSDPGFPCSTNGCDSNYKNVKQLCPYMCNYCQASAGCTKTASDCKNQGTLDPNACTCNCQTGFSGDDCRTCPSVDTHPWAVDWCLAAANPANPTQNRCEAYYNVAVEYCPFTCKDQLDCNN